MDVGVLREALRCGKPRCACARGRNVHCPAHDDTQPSLTLDERDGRILWNCKTGCSQEAVGQAIAALGLEESEPKVARLTTDADHVYRYTDAEGRLLAEKGRWDHPKRFAWRLPGKAWGPIGLTMDQLPLYNLAGLLERAEKPAVLCEGEKATEACLNRGLLAVCLPGGASQQRFGNALDPLMHRKVILWPDNDEQGKALMARVAGLLPQATWLTPVVPPKGDAYDYFEQGGTVDALKALLAEGEPSATVNGADAITVVWPAAGGRVTFAFAQMVAGARSLDCEALVTVEVPGERGLPYRPRLNLMSASAVEGFRRTLANLYPSKALDWTQVVVGAISLCLETWHGIDRSVALADAEVITERRWLVPRYFPEGVVTIPFGMGGSAKSLLNTYLSLCAYFGMPWLGQMVTPVDGVLTVDYEDTEDEWRLRVAELCAAHDWPLPDDSRFRWMPGAGIPLADQGETVRRIIEQHQVGFMVVDSAISAVGGDLIDTQAASRLINWLTTLPVTTSLIAHNTKSDDERAKLYPYGNIFWHNLSRSTIYVEGKQESGSRIMDVTLHPRKAQRGAGLPLAARLTFPERDGGPLSIEHHDYHPEFEPDSEQALRWALVDLLAAGPLSVPRLVEATDAKYWTVSKTLQRYSDYFVRAGRDGRAVMWGLRDRMHEEEA